MTRCARAILAVLILAKAAVAGDAPETLLEEGFYLEVAAADLEGAIRAYEGVLSGGGAPPRIAARARLRLGICQELLGRPDLARAQFEAVAGTAGAEAAAVKIARRHLGEAVLDEPARFMPPDILFYTEVVDPSERIRDFASLLKGTPFENPVDYYMTYLNRSAPEGNPPSAAPGAMEVRHAAAFLNEGFLRELQKVEGMALAVPGDRTSEGDFIAVLFPGKSDIIRGLIQMGLTISNAKPIRHARGIPIFEADEPPEKEGARSEQMCFALGREVILFGRPARLLEEAIERHASGSGSLADTDAFRDARPSRQGAVVFAVIGHERFLQSLRESAKAEDRAGLALAEAVLGTRSLSSLSAAVSWMPASDSLRLAARARFAPALPDAWSALATPPLGSAGIPPTPAGSPGLLALRLDRGAARWDELRKALDPLFEAAEKEGKGELAMIHGLFAEGPGRKLIDDVDGLAIGFAEAPAPGEQARLFASLRSRSPETARALVEETLAELLGKVFRTRASRSFEDVEVPGASGGAPLRARSVEPVPGIRIYLASIAGAVVISPTLELLSGMRAGGPPDFTIPAGAGKAVFLRPSAWLAAHPEDGSHRDILRDVPRAVIAVREDRDAVHADLHVPAFTEVARAILRRIANAQRLEGLEKKNVPGDQTAPR